MSIEQKVTEKMKEAMKTKNQTALVALRALKAEFLLAKTKSGASDVLSEGKKLEIIQKQVKQRKDSALVFFEQGRNNLAEQELEEISVLEQFLPKALNVEEIKKIVNKTISDTGAEGMKDMGKVMKIVSEKLAGKAEGKVIADIVKNNLA